MAKKIMEKMSGGIMLIQQTFEVRHEASGSFIDVRGDVADYIKNKNLFPHWNIDAYTVIFRDSPDSIKKEAAYVSYKNVAYFVVNPEKRSYFVDKT